MEEYVELGQSGQLRLTLVAVLLRGQPTTPLPQAIKQEKTHPPDSRWEFRQTIKVISSICFTPQIRADEKMDSTAMRNSSRWLSQG